MIKNSARMLLAASSVAMLSVLVPAKTQAAPMSFYQYAEAMQGPQQRSFAMSMIRNYENVIKIFKPLVERYGQYSWAESIVENYNWYQTELRKYQALAGVAADAQPVTVVNTTVETNNFTMQDVGPETEAGRTERVVEEVIDYTVNVYLDVTVVYQKTVTTRNMEGIFTTYHYSDGSTRTTVGSREVSRSNTNETREETHREFVRTYEIQPLVASNAVEGETGAQTQNVLTVEEYLARDDVSLAQTETFRQAVLNMNSRINDDYISRESGLAPYGRTLEVIGAPVAWSRGWTGEGSRLAILDTGIDLDHAEFDGRIVAAECFTRACELGYETVDDLNTLSHGTHVAGIAAAALDGVGTTGVAPDAELLIGKVAHNNGFYDFGRVNHGINWAIENGADAINISGNYNVDIIYKRSTEMVTPGVYRSNDTRFNYATAGYAQLMESDYMLPGMASAMQDSETVLVMAAGNQGLDYPTFPAHYAIATDDNGDLLFDGRAIIVGNWDIRLDRIASTSNRAGTMCFEFDAGGECADENRISDWYIMAPGQYVASTDNNGEYRTNSGTSMAAPVVTGAVGVIHQMWPYMTGENIVQLLLETADKDITGYDANVHGQGLLDLDAATSPQGSLGIPTTGRVEGNRSHIQDGNVSLAGGGYISSLENIMAIDDYDRNFAVDGNDMISFADTRTADPVQAAQYGFAPDYYFGYAGGTVVATDTAAMNINSDGSVGVAVTTNNVTFGIVNETEQFLGNYANSALMDVDGATTAYIGYNVDYEISQGLTVFGNASVGVTQLDVNGDSLMQSASTVASNSATIGMRNETKNGTFGVVASLPVAITGGTAEFSTPASVSATGDVEFATTESSLAGNRREVDLGVFHSFDVTENLAVDVHAEARFNYAGSTNTATNAGVNFTWKF